MNHKNQQLKRIAGNALMSALEVAPAINGMFRSLMIVGAGEQKKPVMLVGNAHKRFDDGRCIAILNPDGALLKEISPGVAYTPGILREIVRGRCDALVDVTLIGGRISETCSYLARKPAPARFCVV